AIELGHQVGGEALREVMDRLLVDLPQPGPSILVEGGLSHLVEKGLHHGADAEDLRRLRDRLPRRRGLRGGARRVPTSSGATARSGALARFQPFVGGYRR